MAVLFAGAVLRLLVMVGYAPGFWFLGDTSVYLEGAYSHVPNQARPWGYSFYLWLMSPFHSVRLIVGIQHLVGLGIAVLMYAFLRRRAVSRLLATVAVAPVLLDARTVALEHFLLAEALFTAMLLTALVLLCWRPRPGWVACAGAGALLAGATVTRTIGLPVALLVGLYLVVRWVGWARLGAFALALVIPVAGYMVWYHGHHGAYSLSTYSGRFLWARTTTFVECDQVRLTPAEQQICPAEPIAERRPADVYLWSRHSPAAKFRAAEHDAMFGSFARKAILAQPGDYAWMIAVETWQMSRPGPAPNERYACFDGIWQLPGRPVTACRPLMAPFDPATLRASRDSSAHQHALVGPLHAYSRVATAPPGVVAACFLLVLAAPLVRRRWRRIGPATRRDTVDALMLGGVGFGMVVVSIATSVMEPRYAVPSLPVALLAAALALRPTRSPAPAPTPAPALPHDQGVPPWG
ncbi:hypothetical protein WEI85_15670 [Actinomycetes bacterium KLBMP 9797]